MLAFTSIPMEIPYPQHPTPHPATPALFVFFSGIKPIQTMCAMLGDYHIFTKLLCSFFTKIDIPTLKYLARYTRPQ